MKNNIDPIAEFPKVEKIIYNLAHRFSNTYPISYDECLSEGNMAYMKACADYNAARGQKFSSWVYYWVWCKLKDLVINRSKNKIEFVEANEETLGMAPPAVSNHHELIEDLSQDAKEIISLLTETPSELIGMSMTPKQFMKKVKEYLVKMGRDKAQVNRAHEELRVRFNEVWA